MRILHVVESMGAGVMTSVLTMADATPDIEHHLAVWPRREHADTGDRPTGFRAVHRLPAGLRPATSGLRDLVRQVRPDVVHAHSSYAGLLARAARPTGAAVAYSPHCFAFERRDLARAPRQGIRAAERALVRRTDLVVAVAPHEADLARELGHAEVAVVPNRAMPATPAVARYATPLHVVTAGRIGAQKDPGLFVEVRRHAEEVLGLRARWTWLGGGDADAERTLRDGGVEVTGWLPREELLARLGTAQVYLHTAAWEAAPMSVLEAAGAGLPLAVRAIPALVSLGTPGTAAGARALAERVARLASEPSWHAARTASLELAARHSRDAQRAALLSAYARLGDVRPRAAGPLQAVGR